ncbi:MAG TPA: hypothetical protein VFV48_10080 [Pseudomonadales bacterium]|nr:hypothetical protein [Pseudomonadales bacterium]
MTSVQRVFFCCAFLTYTMSAIADISVIVNPANVQAIDKVTLRKIFLGKQSRFPDDTPAIPLAQPEYSRTAQQFNLLLLNKNKIQYKSHWARLIFTGQGHPPETAYNDREVIEYVKNHPEAVSYIDSSALNKDVKEVLRLNLSRYQEYLDQNM